MDHADSILHNFRLTLATRVESRDALLYLYIAVSCGNYPAQSACWVARRGKSCTSVSCEESQIFYLTGCRQ
jgi:hypothetical protein